MKFALAFGALILSLVTLAWLLPKEIQFESLESKSENGGPVFNRIRFENRGDLDIWTMHQSHSGPKSKKWDRIAITIDKSKTPKVATFYQLRASDQSFSENAEPMPLKATCFMCHSNGPRVIRPRNANFAETLQIGLWNLKIKTYGQVVSHALEKGGEVTFRHTGEFNNDVLKVKTCVKCHKSDGHFARGTLHRQNQTAIQFMVDQGLMPPFPFRMSDEERIELKRFLKGF